MALAVSPTTKAFASIAHGSNESQAFTLTPDSTSDSIFGVVITGPDAAQFSTDEVYDKPPAGAQVSQYGNSQVIAGGATSTFNVTYAPTAAGSHTASLDIHYNGVAGAYVLSVPLTGTAT